jgi:hypothetical protein
MLFAMRWVLEKIIFNERKKMPIKEGYDQDGHFYQWGNSGKRYYFNRENEEERNAAYIKAQRQRTAIYARGWREKR